MTDWLQRVAVGVHHWDGTTIHVLARAAELVAIVMLNAARINRVRTGSITFTWSETTTSKTDLRDYGLEHPDVASVPEHAA